MHTQKILLSAAVAAAAVLGVVGCGDNHIFYVELEEPRVCKTIPAGDLPPFPGTPPGSELRAEIAIPLGGVLQPLQELAGSADAGYSMETEVTVRLVEMTLTAQTGVTDFNDVESVTISVMPSGGLPKATLLQYTKDAANPPGASITVAGSENLNLADYIAAGGGSDAGTSVDGGTGEGDVTFEAVMTGTMPANEWTADMQVCLYLKARGYYLSQWGL